MSPHKPGVLLLPLPHDDAIVVRNALNVFIAREEASGDVCGYGATAEQIADRLCEMWPLLTVHCDEKLKAMGLGRYEGRRQG